jgi:hypothetical protein
MANMLQSSQNKTTTVPSFYTNYLTNLATKGQQAAEGANYVGAQPLQTKAFETACQNAGAAKPAYQTGMGYLGCAANKNISGAAQPFLNEAQQTNTGQLAQCYMSPYINNAIQSMSDIGMRNIQQNIAPQATAAAVGSGQFGSQRGAQVAGQLEANAMQDLNSQIANLMNTGYGTAMNAATQRQALLNQLGSTAATAGAECARAKQAAGVGMGQLGTQLTNANIACINALATLGGQQQTIGQNAQCFDLSKYAKLAGIMQGAQIPTGVKTTMCASPFSTIGQIGTGALGILCKIGQNPDMFKNIKCGFKNIFGPSPSDTNTPIPPYHDPVYDPPVVGDPALPEPPPTPEPSPIAEPSPIPMPSLPEPTPIPDPTLPEPLLPAPPVTDPVISDPISCFCIGFCPYQPNFMAARGGLIHSRNIGAMGCASTRHRGGLPRG